MLLTACGAQDMGVASVLVVATVDVDPPSGSVVLGRTLQLTATPKTEGGIALPADDVVWSSSNTATATVSTDGVVTGHSVGGPVRIRATVEGVTGETQIMVVPFPVDHVVVTPGSSNISVGQQATLTATAYDAADNVLTGRTFTWSSAAPNTVAVTTTGLVLGMAPGGPVLITATADGKSDDAAVTVTQRVVAQLLIVQEPSAAAAHNVAFLQQPSIKVTDASGNPMAGITVTAAIHTKVSGSGVLAGTLTAVTTTAGIATFSGLSITKAGRYILDFSSAGITAVSTVTITIL